MKGRINLLFQGQILKTALFEDGVKLDKRLSGWIKEYGEGFNKIEVRIIYAEMAVEKSKFKKNKLFRNTKNYKP